MMTTSMRAAEARTDAELVAESLSGNRDAFGQIVARYQSLICSLGYSATGSLSHSEDLAQETFFTAWKQLCDLREPAKLRSWLCGMARNLINNWLRRQGREPSHAAETLEAVAGSHAPGPLPPEHTITQEEQAILWRSLERIPEIYREPLVLFYREHQSVENVAAALELSEDAVKQRLSRGRKLLHGQVLAFVEGALERTAPGKVFTFGVLAALPVFATSASAATIGATAAKGSTLAKAAASAGLAGAILVPLIGILGGWLGTKAGIENTESPRERQFMIKSARRGWLFVGLFCAAMFGLAYLAKHWWKTHPVLIAVGFVGLTLVYVAALIVFSLWSNRMQSRIRSEEAAKLPPDAPPRPRVVHPFEYRSRLTLLGLPLVHIQMRRETDGKVVPAKGWIAIGDVAYGILCAFGGVAVGAISMGGLAIGFVSVGGCALGVLTFAGMAIGVWAVGGTAVGWMAFGGGAVAWLAANGGAVLAHDFAVGGAAFARHANDEAARAFIQDSGFFAYATGLMKYAILLAWLPIGLVLWQVFRMGKKKRGRHLFPGALLILFALPGTSCKGAPAAVPAVDSITLTNGMRVVSVHFPASTNVSIFTFVPMGLTSDGLGQAQWSHLVEHLVVRSTMPANSAQANAETLPDHMRLDFYGNTGNWQEGLSHHRRWFEGVPFTDANLAAEKPKVIAECDFTARNFATHKFAVAAWSHGFRHGAKHVALKGDVTKATLADVQRLRDERFAVSNKVSVCLVSGLDAKTVFAEAGKQLGDVRLHAALAPASKAVSTNVALTWDLDARHLLMIWPIPDFRQPDHATLLVAAQGLNMRLGTDPDLKPQIGMVFAGADLTTPEGNFFFISASLRPGADFDALRNAILKQVERLTTSASESAQTAMIGRQLAASFTEIPDPQMIKAQARPGMSLAMLEGNLGLQAGMHAHRYGDQRTVLAQHLTKVSAGNLKETARRYLSAEKAAVCTLRPPTMSRDRFP